MTVVLCGVAADTGNVDPVPAVGPDGRFEYVPIPEKGPTTETATYGSMPRLHDDSVLADAIERVRPGSDGEWVAEADAVADQQVHRDPNFQALTYGEHRPGYVAQLRELDPGDAVAFYAGMRAADADEKHRYCIGWFTVAEVPTVLAPDADREAVAAALADHPDNAHAKRFAAYDGLYYHDADFGRRAKPVVIVPGERPGGLLDRAVRLSDRRRGPNYYMRDGLAEALSIPATGDHGVHLGGIKPALRADCSVEGFRTALAAVGPPGATV